MHLSLLDFVVLAVYIGSLFLLGIFFSSSQTSRDVYFLGGRRVSWLLAGISIIATLLSTVSYLALPGEMIKNGVAFFTGALAVFLFVPAVSRLIIPALMRLPVTSIYDYLERRFGLPARSLGASVFVVTRIIWMGLILYTCSLAITKMTGWNIEWILVGMGLVTMFYTTAGGMSAVLWSDFAQFAILFGGAVYIPCYVWARTGSDPAVWWTAISGTSRAEIPIFSLDPTQRVNAIGMILMVFMWNLCTHSSDQVAAQRYLSTPSANSARRSFIVFCVANFALEALLMLGGLAVFYFYFHQMQQGQLPESDFRQMVGEHADKTFPGFIATELPTGMKGLMLAALLAAAMSSLSSGINSLTTVVETDFLRRFRSRDPDDQTAEAASNLMLPKILAVTVGVLSIVIALAVNALMSRTDWNLVDMIEKLNHLFVAPLGALFVSGILFRRVGWPAALAGFLTGVATSFLVSFSEQVFGYGISFMWIMPASFVVSLTVSYSLGYVFSPPADSQLDVLYHQRSPAE